MSVDRVRLIAILSTRLPQNLVIATLEQYQHVKQQFFLRKYQPSELNAARFCECVLRIIEYINTGSYTPTGAKLDTEKIIKGVENNTKIPDTLRIFIPRLVRVVLDVRNKRDVAHVGGEVSPNYSDSLFVIHATDWILTELVRHFHSCSIQEAHQIVSSINEVKIPVVTEINGFIRVQNTQLDAKKKTLVVLYYKKPISVLDSDLCKWIKYSNVTRYRTDILKSLDEEAMIHYQSGQCILLDKGVLFVEKNIPLDILV
jgi:hypothetical protein